MKLQIKLIAMILLFSTCLFSKTYAEDTEEKPREFIFNINSDDKNPLDFGYDARDTAMDYTKRIKITIIDKRYVQITAERWYKPSQASITFGIIPYGEPAQVKLLVPYVYDSANKSIHILGNVLGNTVTEIPNEDGIINWLFLNLKNFQGITVELSEEGNFKNGSLYSVDGSIFDI